MFERFENVSIRAGIAAEQQSQAGHKESQIAEIDDAPQRIVRFAEIEDKQAPAGLRHPLHLAQPGFPGGQISQTVADGDYLKRVIRKGQSLGIAADNMQIGAWSLELG